MIPSVFGLGLEGTLYAIAAPLIVLQVFALLLIPSLIGSSARPFAVSKAVYCYLVMAIGIVLMTIGGMPALYAVLENMLVGQERFTSEVYVALLLVFSIGGLAFLWHERMVLGIDEASRRVPGAVFWFTFKFIGFVLMLFSGLSFFLTMLLAQIPFGDSWWIMPVLLFLYGLLLSWVTRFPSRATGSFQSAAASSHTAKKPGKKK